MILARAAFLAGAGALLAACAFPHRMERAGPPGSACPQRSEAPAVDAPPDTTVLRWYRSTAGRDHEVGGAACAAAGPPLFVADPAGAFEPWLVGDSVEVVTWDVDGRDEAVVPFLEGRLGLECRGARSTLRGDRPPFVALLQGVARRAAATESEAPGIGRTAERCGLALHYVPSHVTDDADGAAVADVGSAILSTLPLTIPIAIELPVESVRKVAVAATILAPGSERMRVVSTDVDGLSTLARTLLSGNQVRTRQVSGLVDALGSADDDGPLNAATLVGGDFGSWDDRETALRIIRGAFPESPAWDGASTRGSFAPDHVFFRRGSFLTITVGHYLRVEETYGAEHHALRVAVNYLPVAR